MFTSRHFEDFTLGERFETQGYSFTEAEIRDFALRYDPQPFHIDRVAAEASLYGGIIASGFHTLSVCFRLWHMTGLFMTTNLGGRGIEALRWTQAVRPGDTIRCEVEVVAIEPSSKPDRGSVIFALTAREQGGATVMTVRLQHYLARRNVAPA